MVHALAVHLSSYGCTWEVGRALEKLEKNSVSPPATQRLLSCSPNFPSAHTPSMDHFFINSLLCANYANLALILVSRERGEVGCGGRCGATL